jgi:hypothetical protein
VRLVACGKKLITPFMTTFEIRSADSSQPCTPNPMRFIHAANEKKTQLSYVQRALLVTTKRSLSPITIDRMQVTQLPGADVTVEGFPLLKAHRVFDI